MNEIILMNELDLTSLTKDELKALISTLYDNLQKIKGDKKTK